ncbi:MAG: trimethyllysine dioxygenase [Acidiferrobacterales bacterium]
MSKQLASVQIAEEGLILVWSDVTRSAPIPWLWLRDHCQCAECVHPETRQRLVNTFQLPQNISAARAELSDNGNSVGVIWHPDGHRSRYPVDLLDGEFATAVHAVRKPELWDATVAENIPRVAYDAVMSSDDGLLRWLGAIEHFGFCFVHGTPPTANETRQLAERVGYLRQTIFGDLWEFEADLSRGDTAYTNLELLPHTDGTYSHDAPGLQMLHCLQFSGTGGESVLVDGFRVADELRREAPDAFETLCRIRVPGQYIEPGIHLMANRPVFRLDDRGAVIQVSFNNYDRAPLRMSPTEAATFYAASRAFDEIVQRSEMQLRFALTPGEALLFDNWRLLHGRAAFEGKRHVVGCYLNREDFESRVRVLRTAAV